jgi:dolichol-phosphate mannosyltransferase
VRQGTDPAAAAPGTVSRQPMLPSRAMREVVVLLPVFNEGARLEHLLDGLEAALAGRPHRIIAVDDGSRDGTAEILRRRAEALPLVTLTHPLNAGLAQTLYDGLHWVVEHAGDDDVVVTMDADDTHDPAYIAPLLAKLEDGYDVVGTSRFQPGGGSEGVPRHRQALGRAGSIVMQLALPIPGVREFSCCYRAIRVGALRRAAERFGDELIALRQWGFVCTAELLWKLHAAGARCSEIPFVLHYDRKQSESRMRALRTLAGYAALAWHSRVVRHRR